MGLDFAIAGRTEPKLKDLACRLDASYYVFAQNDNAILDSILKDTVVILNCAGPYIRTVKRNETLPRYFGGNRKLPAGRTIRQSCTGSGYYTSTRLMEGAS